MTSSTHERKSKTNIVMSKAKMYLRHNAFTEDINVVIVMKAMGAESDQEIVQLVGEEEELAMLLIPTIQDCKQKVGETKRVMLNTISLSRR